MREAAETYHLALADSPAEDFLGTRGLAYPSIIRETDARFRLGFVDDPLTGHEQYRGFLSIPYLRWSPGQQPEAADARPSSSTSGREFGWAVVSIRFRRLDNGSPKYLTVAGDRPRLYNTTALLKQTPIVGITEGEIDCISAESCGIPSVGVAGAENWKPHFREPFLGYREVFVFADGDEAGMRFATTVAKTLPNAKVIPFPPGQDVNSFVKQQGPEALREKLK